MQGNLKVLDFIFVEEHVGNAIVDGKYSAGFRTGERSIDDFDFEE